MLTPMNKNSYRDHVTAIRNAAETEAKRSMANASRETKEFYEPEDDGIYNIGVSGDGTWRRRGYSSAYGVVTALSTVTGKVLDVEIMSKECRECMRFYRSLEFIQDNIVLWHVRNWTITDCAILVAKAPKGPKVGESSCET